MFVKALEVPDIAPGGMKAVQIEGQEIVICNYDGRFYAVGRRCSHMNASLDMGTLEGYILTCPLHFAQFDITTGEALSGPVPRAEESGPFKTPDIKTYLVQVEGGIVKVDVNRSCQ
jgi:nitrite reductase/ring-hydroxylating ferredoxin subunit